MKLAFRHYFCLVVIVTSMVFFALVLKQSKVQAQGQDVKLYEFDSKMGSSGSYIRLYKTIYQGCELFVVAKNQDVAITTGRGCK